MCTIYIIDRLIAVYDMSIIISTKDWPNKRVATNRTVTIVCGTSINKITYQHKPAFLLILWYMAIIIAAPDALCERFNCTQSSVGSMWTRKTLSLS